MPEDRVLLCTTALDEAEAAERLMMLHEVDWPNASKILITLGKFNTGGSVRNFNVEAGYPPEPSRLQTLAAWTATACDADPRFRDAFDLFYVCRLIAKHLKDFDQIILLREGSGVAESLPDLVPQSRAQRFLMFGGDKSTASGTSARNVIFNLTHEGAVDLLALVEDLYISGAAYALSPYSLESALSAAADAQHLVHQIVAGPNPNCAE